RAWGRAGAETLRRGSAGRCLEGPRAARQPRPRRARPALRDGAGHRGDRGKQRPKSWYLLHIVSDENPISAFRPVPRTGVIYVMTEAQKKGFSSHDPEWANLGQGQPETGPLPGAPERVDSVTVHVDDQEY